jgi:hypothetical protein
MIIGRAGRKASNVQNKWGSTASITAGVSTVKKNVFSNELKLKMI